MKQGLRKFGPRPRPKYVEIPEGLPIVFDKIETEKPCPACGKHFREGDFTALIALGPGDSEEARQKCRENRPFNAVALEVHWACATGEL